MSLLLVDRARPWNPSELATGFGSAAFKIVRTGDTDGDGRDEIVILKADRYRVYTEPNTCSQWTEKTGSFYVTLSVSNLPFMALANVDGGGQSGPIWAYRPIH